MASYDGQMDVLDLLVGDDGEGVFYRPVGKKPPGGRPRTQQRPGRPRGYAPWKPQKKTMVIVNQVLEILDEYAAHLPLTIRQIFYRLVGAYAYPKDEKAYKRLCEYMNRGRRAHMIDMDALRDDGISVMASSFYDGVEAFWDDVARQARNYRRNRQQGQRQMVELWCEASGMMPQLALEADGFSVPVYSNSGFVSIPSVRTMVAHALRNSVPTVILHVGDLDPSGDSIFTAMTEDAAAFVEQERVLATQKIVPVRVALTGAQVLQYKLPTAPPKPKKDGTGYADGRTPKWLTTPDAKLTGGGTVQCEALAPNDLAAIVRMALEDVFDLEKVSDHITTEHAERTQLLRALPRGSDE
jgi:hypothetical protein